MKIAVLSGKGGTGKTFVSTNIARLLKCNYVDLDVEAPNGYIFLKPDNISIEDVLIDYPVIDKNKCTYCGKCEEACAFNAIAITDGYAKVFEKLCHGCGTCKIVCEYDALVMNQRPIGKITTARYENGFFYEGKLNISEPLAVPIINETKKKLNDAELNILDCPPGTSCSVVNSLKETDYAVLVTEPTPFGLHDLEIAYGVAKKMGVKAGVVINRSINDDSIIEEFIEKNNIELLGKIPFSKDIAVVYSNGELIENGNIFEEIIGNFKKEVKWK